MGSKTMALLIALLAVCCVQGALSSHRHSNGKREHESSCFARAAGAPNILLVILDDVGVASLPFTARQTRIAPGTPYFEAQFPDYMPNTANEAARGMRLDRHYSAAECTPARQALLSGRLPIHNGIIMKEPIRWDGGVDKDSGYDGVNSNITSMAHKLKAAGYLTHMVGKADGFGQATYFHTPRARGFDTALTYFNHANDMYTYEVGVSSIGFPPACQNQSLYPDGPFYQDLFWDTGSPKGTRYSGNCTGPASNRTCIYEEELFKTRLLDIINEHQGSKPFFAYYASRQAHTPLQVPQNYTDFILAQCGPNANTIWRNTCNVKERYQYLAMLKQFDDMFGEIVRALKARGLYESTLIVFQSDNGAPVGQGTGGNSFPLHGGKASSWEGAFRVPAFVGGGAIPVHMRGTSYTRPTHTSDWYATFCELAGGNQICTGWGADPTGEVIPGIVPVESVDLWPFLNGSRSDSPHPVLALSPNALIVDRGTAVYKLLTGITNYDMLMSPSYPNCTVCKTSCAAVSPSQCNPPNSSNIPCQACSPTDRAAVCCNDGARPASGSPFAKTPQLPKDCGNGCLFELVSDPAENVDLCGLLPQLCTDMQSMLFTQNLTYYEPFRGCPLVNPGCIAARDAFNGTYGPFLNTPNCPTCVHVTAAYRANPNPPYKRTTNECQCILTEDTCRSNSGNPLNCVWDNVTRSCEGLSFKSWVGLRRWNFQYFDSREADGIPESLQ